jgi:DNA polymerase-3 subunit alpha/error-prone DNA polymerase
MISSFAGYSFCKAHSASYAMVSFQCAYLKAHHPAYFMSRVISNGGGFYDRSAYVEEARRMGIRIHGPCVLRSAYATTHEQGGQALRLGLHCIAQVHVAHAQTIISECQRQPFRGFTELYVRCPMSMREYLALEEAGALNKLLANCNQPRRLWLIKRVAQLFPRPHIKAALRSYVEQHGYSDPLPPALADVSPLQIWRRRFACIGCLPYSHPLCLWPATQGRRQHHCSDITAAVQGHHVTLVAWSITAKQVEAVQKKDRRGRLLDEPQRQAMSFVTLEDETGIIESVWFPRSYQRYGHLLAERQPLQVSGRVQVEFNFVSLEVEEVTLLNC